MDQRPQPNPYYTPDQVQPTSPPEEQNGKRKAEIGDNQPQQRSKRNRYISIACNECKRRKIKCNGETQCTRCAKLGLECIYAPNCCSSNFKDSTEFKALNADIAILKQQVNDLYNHIHALRSGQSPYPLHPSLTHAESPTSYRNNLSPSLSRASHPPFQGPTSSAFNLDVAKSSLQTMGITQPEVQDDARNNDIDPALGAEPAQQAPIAAMVSNPREDPLWQLTKGDAIRLCRIYEEAIGMMYPMLDIEKIIASANMLFSYIDRHDKYEVAGTEILEANDVNILRMVLASGLTAEGGGQSVLGRAIYESCREAVGRALSGPLEINSLTLLVTVAEYHFQEDEEAQAYRVIGLAGRMVLEMGLHRRQTLVKRFPDEDARNWAIKLFWSIYVLDRRWSFGLGMPFELQDADIDPALPEPDASAPYLTAMVSYSRISAKIWRSISKLEGGPNKIDRENIGYLDYQMLQWHETIPESLRFNPATDNFSPPTGVSRGHRRFEILLYLRTNQMRTLIYRPVLHAATTIMEHRQAAQTGVDVAKDTIRVLTRLNETTDIYTTQQVCFNYFLLSALAVIFLAASHAPIEFSHQVRDEFYQALDLVKGFSNKYYISKRLWTAIKGLKDIGSKLGPVNHQANVTDSRDAHSSAAVAMAGLAGRQMEEVSACTPTPNPMSVVASSMDGQQMSNELTHLFEAVKGYGNGPPTTGGQGMEGSSTNGFDAPMADRIQGERLSGVYGNPGEFSRILGGLFQI